MITKIEIASDAAQQPKAAVEGYFVFVTIIARGLDRDLIPINLNSDGPPIRFILPPGFFEGMLVDEICAKDVKAAFTKLMRVPFGPIPRRPLDQPIYKIPPSKREKVVRQMLRQQMADAMPVPPEKEMEE